MDLQSSLRVSTHSLLSHLPPLSQASPPTTSPSIFKKLKQIAQMKKSAASRENDISDRELFEYIIDLFNEHLALTPAEYDGLGSTGWRPEPLPPVDSTWKQIFDSIMESFWRFLIIKPNLKHRQQVGDNVTSVIRLAFQTMPRECFYDVLVLPHVEFKHIKLTYDTNLLIMNDSGFVTNTGEGFIFYLGTVLPLRGLWNDSGDPMLPLWRLDQRTRNTFSSAIDRDAIIGPLKWWTEVVRALKAQY